MAGDVYSRPPHVGRGGWTWYTGSASWLYRTLLEATLGLRREGDRLVIDPRIPPDWPGFEIVYRFRSATYRIAVQNPQGVESGTPAVSGRRPAPARAGHPPGRRRSEPSGPPGHGALVTGH